MTVKKSTKSNPDIQSGQNHDPSSETIVGSIGLQGGMKRVMRLTRDNARRHIERAIDGKATKTSNEVTMMAQPVDFAVLMSLGTCRRLLWVV